MVGLFSLVHAQSLLNRWGLPLLLSYAHQPNFTKYLTLLALAIPREPFGSPTGFAIPPIPIRGSPSTPEGGDPTEVCLFSDPALATCRGNLKAAQ